MEPYICTLVERNCTFQCIVTLYDGVEASVACSALEDLCIGDCGDNVSVVMSEDEKLGVRRSVVCLSGDWIGGESRCDFLVNRAGRDVTQ